MESSEFIDLLDIIKQAIKSISFSEVLYVGDDNRIYGNQYVISIDCNDTAASQAIPFKSVVITGNYDNFKYSDINIKLPADAQAAL